MKALAGILASAVVTALVFQVVTFIEFGSHGNVVPGVFVFAGVGAVVGVVIAFFRRCASEWLVGAISLGAIWLGFLLVINAIGIAAPLELYDLGVLVVSAFAGALSGLAFKAVAR